MSSRPTPTGPSGDGAVRCASPVRRAAVLAVAVICSVVMAQPVGANDSAAEETTTTSSTTTTTSPPTTEATTTTAAPTTTEATTTTPATTPTAPPTTEATTTTAAPTTTRPTTTAPPATAATSTTANPLLVAGPPSARRQIEVDPDTQPAPDVEQLDEPGEAVPTEGTDDTERLIRWVVIGLVAVAVLLTALAVYYWWITRPGPLEDRTDEVGSPAHGPDRDVDAAAESDDPDPRRVD